MVAVAVVLAGSTACAPSLGADTAAPSRSIETTEVERVSPRERAVIIETTACGRADGATGSGVIFRNGLVVTAAHVVIAATSISVQPTNGPPVPGRLVALDTRRDLAIVAVDRPDLPSVEFGSTVAGDTGFLVGGARSGTTPFETIRRVRVEIDEVRGTERAKRDGYETAALTGTGDSGAGLYNSSDQLVGIVFATSTDDNSVTWATAVTELTPVIEAIDLDATFKCDPNASRIIPIQR